MGTMLLMLLILRPSGVFGLVLVIVLILELVRHIPHGL